MSHVPRTAVLFAWCTALACAPLAHAADPAPAATPAQPRINTEEPAQAARAPLAASATALDGIWMFDAAHSDDPMKVMQAQRAQRGGGEGGPPMGAGGGGFGGGFGGGRRGGGGPGGPGGMRGGGDEIGGDHPDQPAENRPRGPSPMSRVMRPAKKVVIDMQADVVNVIEDEMPARPYAVADSLKAHDHELLTENTSAKWKNGRLEMTQTMGERGKLVEVYELSPDGKTLTIRAHREGGREGMPNPVLTRVYTRYDGE